MEKRKRIILKDEIQKIAVFRYEIDHDIRTLEKKITQDDFRINALLTSSQLLLNDLTHLWEDLENIQEKFKAYKKKGVDINGEYKRTRKSARTGTK